MRNMTRRKTTIKNAPYSQSHKKDMARKAWMKNRTWVNGHYLADGRFKTGSWVLNTTLEEEE
jgi:hypothetical protein